MNNYLVIFKHVKNSRKVGIMKTYEETIQFLAEFFPNALRRNPQEAHDLNVSAYAVARIYGKDYFETVKEVQDIIKEKM